MSVHSKHETKNWQNIVKQNYLPELLGSVVRTKNQIDRVLRSWRFGWIERVGDIFFGGRCTDTSNGKHVSTTQKKIYKYIRNTMQQT